MTKGKMIYSITSVDNDFIGDTPDKIIDMLNEGTNYINYDYKNHRYLITFISDSFNIFDKIEEDRKEIERLSNIINELEKEWKKQQEYYIHYKDNRYRTFLSKNLDKLKELKEIDEK